MKSNLWRLLAGVAGGLVLAAVIGRRRRCARTLLRRSGEEPAQRRAHFTLTDETGAVHPERFAQ
jgi:hypothetical protein